MVAQGSPRHDSGVGTKCPDEVRFLSASEFCQVCEMCENKGLEILVSWTLIGLVANK